MQCAGEINSTKRYAQRSSLCGMCLNYPFSGNKTKNLLCASLRGAAAVERRKKGCSCEQIIPQRAAAVEDGSKINGSGICTESARKREKEREQTISQSSERAPNSMDIDSVYDVRMIY